MRRLTFTFSPLSIAQAKFSPLRIYSEVSLIERGDRRLYQNLRTLSGTLFLPAPPAKAGKRCLMKSIMNGIPEFLLRCRVIFCRASYMLGASVSVQLKHMYKLLSFLCSRIPDDVDIK